MDLKKAALINKLRCDGADNDPRIPEGKRLDDLDISELEHIARERGLLVC